MRYWVALQRALSIPDLKENRMMAKAEEVKSLLERNEFNVDSANTLYADFNAIRNVILRCSSRPKECIEAIQQMHGLCSE